MRAHIFPLGIFGCLCDSFGSAGMQNWKIPNVGSTFFEWIYNKFGSPHDCLRFEDVHMAIWMQAALACIMRTHIFPLPRYESFLDFTHVRWSSAVTNTQNTPSMNLTFPSKSTRNLVMLPTHFLVVSGLMNVPEANPSWVRCSYFGSQWIPMHVFGFLDVQCSLFRHQMANECSPTTEQWAQNTTPLNLFGAHRVLFFAHKTPNIFSEVCTY